MHFRAITTAVVLSPFLVQTYAHNKPRRRQRREQQHSQPCGCNGLKETPVERQQRQLGRAYRNRIRMLFNFLHHALIIPGFFYRHGQIIEMQS